MVNYAKTADDLDSFFRRKKAETNISYTKEADLVGPDYAVDACNAIVQFQHFLELFIKDILFDINPLMVYDPARKPLLPLKMAQGVGDNQHLRNHKPKQRLNQIYPQKTLTNGLNIF